MLIFRQKTVVNYLAELYHMFKYRYDPNFQKEEIECKFDLTREKLTEFSQKIEHFPLLGYARKKEQYREMDFCFDKDLDKNYVFNYSNNKPVYKKKGLPSIIVENGIPYSVRVEKFGVESPFIPACKCLLERNRISYFVTSWNMDALVVLDDCLFGSTLPFYQLEIEYLSGDKKKFFNFSRSLVDFLGIREPFLLGSEKRQKARELLIFCAGLPCRQPMTKQEAIKLLGFNKTRDLTEEEHELVEKVQGRLS